MRVYVVAGYRKSEIWFSSEITEDWPTEYRVIDVFESEADAESFCTEKKGDGWRYTIFGKDVVRNSSAEYKHPVVTSPAFDVNMSEEMYERYKKFVEGENK